MRKAEAEFQAYQEVLESTRQQSTHREPDRWLRPAVDYIKVNWDATINAKNSKMGIGIMIRDVMGEVLACLSVPKPFQSPPLIAECWALR